jgi:hypothetical protein
MASMKELLASFGQVCVPAIIKRETLADEQRNEKIGFAPTTARAGTEDKVKVMQARIAAGLPLFHINDPLYEAPPECNGDERNFPRIARKASLGRSKASTSEAEG